MARWVAAIRRAWLTDCWRRSAELPTDASGRFGRFVITRTAVAGAARPAVQLICRALVRGGGHEHDAAARPVRLPSAFVHDRLLGQGLSSAIDLQSPCSRRRS